MPIRYRPGSYVPFCSRHTALLLPNRSDGAPYIYGYSQFFSCGSMTCEKRSDGTCNRCPSNPKGRVCRHIERCPFLWDTGYYPSLYADRFLTPGFPPYPYRYGLGFGPPLYSSPFSYPPAFFSPYRPTPSVRLACAPPLLSPLDGSMA